MAMKSGRLINKENIIHYQREVSQTSQSLSWFPADKSESTEPTCICSPLGIISIAIVDLMDGPTDIWGEQIILKTDMPIVKTKIN